MIDEGFNLSFEITWQEVVFEQDAVLQGLVPAFDLALSLRVVWRAARVLKEKSEQCAKKQKPIFIRSVFSF